MNAGLKEGKLKRSVRSSCESALETLEKSLERLVRITKEVTNGPPGAPQSQGSTAIAFISTAELLRELPGVIERYNNQLNEVIDTLEENLL